MVGSFLQINQFSPSTCNKPKPQGRFLKITPNFFFTKQIFISCIEQNLIYFIYIYIYKFDVLILQHVSNVIYTKKIMYPTIKVQHQLFENKRDDHQSAAVGGVAVIKDSVCRLVAYYMRSHVQFEQVVLYRDRTGFTFYAYYLAKLHVLYT